MNKIFLDALTELDVKEHFKEDIITARLKMQVNIQEDFRSPNKV